MGVVVHSGHEMAVVLRAARGSCAGRRPCRWERKTSVQVQGDLVQGGLTLRTKLVGKEPF